MSKNAIISVYDKSGIDELVAFLFENDYHIWSSGGTYKYICNLEGVNPESVHKIVDETGFPEILGGRVKTLQKHPCHQPRGGTRITAL